MKKRISILLICLMLLSFSLFGCATEAEPVTYDQDLVDETIDFVITYGQSFDEESLAEWESYPEYIQNYSLMTTGLLVEADAFDAAVASWQAGVEECGAFLGMDEFTYDASSDGLDVVTTAYYADREAEITFSFDKNVYLETLTVSAKMGTGEILSKAGMNTLLGMGVVFFVLILMCFIIYLFKFIPIIQEKITGKKPAGIETEEKEKPKEEAAPVVEAVPASSTNDTELVAVISAAIAASEGTGTDGFVVRSIRRRPPRKRNS